MTRKDHLFQFAAGEIARAAQQEADHHEGRRLWWSAEYERAVAIVQATAGVKIIRQQVTGGERVDVAVDYGDPIAYRRMQEAFEKIQAHRKAAEAYRSDAVVYGTQGDRVYEVGTEDVAYFRLAAQPREDDR